MRADSRRAFGFWLAVALAVVSSGCTSWREYIANGFKVGPNYCRPAAPVADHWIDDKDPNVSSAPADDAAWWHTFNDPVLDRLVQTAYQQNLTLRVAGLRILEARAQRAVVVGELFPQTQQSFGSYTRSDASENNVNSAPARFSDDWNLGAGLAWELDFWGRFRRAIESADANLDVSIENYDDALVLLLSEVAQSYVDLRTAEQRIQYAAKNVVIQRGSLFLAELRYDDGHGKVSRLDVTQAHSSLSEIEATVLTVEIARRQATNQLCILLGMPPGNLDRLLENQAVTTALQDMHSIRDIANRADAPAAREQIDRIVAIRKKPVEKVIPTTPAQIAVGVPAELLRRRPDVRSAERQVAAQSALIGVATSDLYPHFSITGSIFFDANNFKDLFEGRSVAGSVGPSFQWNILNYGRLVNNIRVQDALFQQLATQYQNTVLQANAEAENAIIAFLLTQEQVIDLTDSTNWGNQSLDLAERQYYEGQTDFNRVFIVQQTLTQEQDRLAVAEGAVASNLILLYKALGGGWQIRLSGPSTGADAANGTTGEPVPAPAANPAPVAIPTPPSAAAPMPPSPTDRPSNPPSDGT